MKKILLTAVCGTLALAMAVPAMAEHQLGGYYRLRFGMSQHQIADERDPDQALVQRWRARWANVMSEYVSIVFYGEINNVFGQVSGADSGDTREGRYSGGGLDTDGVNLQTKQLYLDVKVPDTPVAFRTGLQWYADNWNAVLFDMDAAGATVGAKAGMVDANLGYFKLSESTGPGFNGINQDDDQDLWGLKLAFKPMEGVSAGVDGYWLNDNGADLDIYTVGANAGMKVQMVDVSGFIAYQGGTQNNAAPGGSDLDFSAFAGSVRGALDVAGVKAALRLFYFSPDDDSSDSDSESWQTLANFAFTDTNSMIFFPDLYGTGGIAGGGIWTGVLPFGLWGGVVTGQFVPPAMPQMYVKAALGQYFSIEDDRNPAAGDDREGTNVGAEITARVGYKLAEVVDLSLNGAYMFLGDFYDNQAADADTGLATDPDNLYSLYAMVQVLY